MELDPQPDYKLLHHMAVVSPVAAVWYIIGLVNKKKRERHINFKVFFILSPLAPLHFIICFTFPSK